MSWARRARRGTGLAFALTSIASSFYCLLAFIPFTYYQFLQFSHWAWIDWFVRWHPYVYLAAFALAATSWIAARRKAISSIWIAGFLTLGGGTGVVLLVRPVLANLQNDTASYLWSLFFLVPLAWLATVELRAGIPLLAASDRAEVQEFRVLWAAAGTALFVTVLGFLVAWMRGFAPGEFPFGELVVLGWSLTAHLALLIGFFLVLGLLQKVAGLFPRSLRAELLLLPALVGFLFSVAVREIVLRGVAFTGAAADLYAAAIGLTVAYFMTATGLRLAQESTGRIGGGLEPLLRSLAPSPDATLMRRGSWLVAVSATIAWAMWSAGTVDWDFRLQKLLAGTLWLIAFPAFYFAFQGVRGKKVPSLALVVIPLACAGLFRGADLWAAQGRSPVEGSEGSLAATLSRYSMYDGSFRLAGEALTPTRVSDLYRFLQKNTNIPHDVHVDPVEIDFVAELTPGRGARPDIHIFTIDSLRRDYLSPHNAAVEFTPAIESFAADAVVFRNAFSRYGATGLSEPSIWTGGMLLHKQYTTPYHPMNTLQKLMEAEGYELHITNDTILASVVRPSASVKEIHSPEGRSFPLCQSLETIQNVLAARPDDGPPILTYAQPQDIHISVINREGRDVPGGGSYEGFFAPYAARVRRMDRCFGEFIGFLKERGLYDRSIIVLTSDHGDSLGEEGRWGHAYTVFEEVLAVPLIVHLPEEMREAMTWDENDIAFTSDITPSLYYLFGQRPILYEPVLGRPLFTETAQEAKSYLRDDYLVASSYGAVYGILRDNGRRLFIADAVNFRDYYFDLGGEGGAKARTITPEVRAEFYERIRDELLAIHQFYRHPVVE